MELFINALLVVQSVLLGSIFARIDGGGFGVKLPEWLERIACMSFFVIACAPSAGIFSIFALLGVFGLATGHGQYFPTIVKKEVKPEYFDFIVAYFFGPEPRNGNFVYSDDFLYQRCAFGMFVTGSLVGIPAALIGMATGNLWCFALMLTGVAKAMGYHIGFKLTGSTEAGELLNGAFRTLLCMIAFIGGI